MQSEKMWWSCASEVSGREEDKREERGGKEEEKREREGGVADRILGIQCTEMATQVLCDAPYGTTRKTFIRPM